MNYKQYVYVYCIKELLLNHYWSVYVYVYVCVYVCMCMYVYVCVCMCMCIYVYVYVYYFGFTPAKFGIWPNLSAPFLLPNLDALHPP